MSKIEQANESVHGGRPKAYDCALQYLDWISSIRGKELYQPGGCVFIAQREGKDGIASWLVPVT